MFRESPASAVGLFSWYAGDVAGSSVTACSLSFAKRAWSSESTVRRDWTCFGRPNVGDPSEPSQ